MNKNTKGKNSKSTKKTTSKKKGSGLFMKIAVALIILQAIVYTWVHLYLSTSVGVEIAPMTSVAFYTFCLGELSVCGLIKKSKQ